MNKNGFQGLCINNERGSAMVEFAMMMPLFVIMIMFLIICYQGVESHIRAQVNAYSDMRSKVKDAGGGPCRIVTGAADDKVVINSAMARWTGHSYIPVHIDLSTYAGTYTGLEKSIYRRSDVRYRLP